MIRLAEKIINDKDIDDLKLWLDKSGRLTMGEETIQFEEEWSDWLGCEYSVFVNSGSSANLLVMLSMLYSGRLRNKKVIVPAVGWATTAAPAIQLGFEPILCDADKDDLGLDLEDFENLCKIHRPSMVVLVHVLGHASKLNDLLKICEKYDVFLIEDTCEAYGSKFVNKKLGTFGTASTFSFFYGHQMSTIEGGMVSTDDRELYNIMLSVRSHGWLRDNEEYFREKHLKKYGVAEKFEYSYFFTYPGLNVRNTDLNAFIGRGQIKKIDSFIEKRNLNYYRFVENLKGKIWIQESNTSPVSALAFGVIDESRKRITDALIKENVECRPLICGSIQEHPFWFERYPKRDMPMALKVHKNGFYVPCHHKLTFDEIDFMCNIILENKKYRSF